MRIPTRPSSRSAGTIAALIGALALLFATLPACSDDPTEPTADTAAPADTVEADAIADDVAADTATGCEHPCRNQFGNNDRRLCPEPVSDWICTQGCCQAVFRCATDDDCATGGFDEGQCTDDRFACRCDVPTGTCGAWYCGADADCGAGETCAAGACVALPDASTLTLRILDRHPVLSTGATYTLHVDGLDPADADVALAVTATFESSAPAVVSVDADGVLTGGTEAGDATITATLSGGASTATITATNVLFPEDAHLAAAVIDEVTRAPLTGSYAVVNADTGALLVEAAIPADGVIVYTPSVAEGVDLHVFADGHDWVSWLGAADGARLVLPIAQTFYSRVELSPEGDIVAEDSSLEGVGVLAGIPDLSLYERLGELELSLNSFALSSALFDFNLQVLLGADVKRYLDPDHNIPQVDPTEPLTVPGGITFNLAGPAVPSFVLSAPAGSHRLWSLGGRLDLSEIAQYASEIIDSVAGGDLDFTRIVGAVFPLFRGFWSGYVPEVTVTTTGDPDTILAIDPLLRVPLGLASSLDVPTLPSFGDLGWADALFLLGGALTADGFMIPLGLNGGADTADKNVNPPDGVADADERTPEKDPYPLPLAPAHSGLQSPHAASLIAVVAVAIPGRDDPRPEGGSAILSRGEPGAAPPASPDLGEFLPFPIDSAWDPETRALTVGAVDGADTQRLLFKGRQGAHWTVWLNGRTTWTVPTPADLVADLPDRATEEVQLVFVNSLDLAAGMSLADVVAPGGVDLDTLLGHVDRISFMDVKKPFPAPPAR